MVEVKVKVLVRVTNVFKGKLGVGDAIITGIRYKKEKGDFTRKLTRLKINSWKSTFRLPKQGEFVEAYGRWVTFENTWQLLVEKCTPIPIPMEIVEIELVKSPLLIPPVYLYYFDKHPAFEGLGLGPKRLQKAIDHVGSFTLFMADLENYNTKSLMDAFNGNYVRARGVIDGYHELQAEIDTARFLADSGLDNNEIKKIISLLGTTCHETIKSNPYCLLAFGSRLAKKAWILAEDLKEKLEISDNDPRRLLGSVDKIVYDALSEGHTAILIEKASDDLASLLKDVQLGKEAIKLALKNRTACLIGDCLQGVGPAELEIYVEKSFSKLLNLNSPMQGQLFDALEIEYVSQATEKYAAKFEKTNGYRLVAKQIEAIKMAFTTGLVVLQGEGGTGKTTALSGIKAVGIEIDRPVYFVALAGVAQRKIYRDLHKQGLINNIPTKDPDLEIEEPTCFTIHSFINAIYKTKKAKKESPFNLKLNQKPIIVMDESSMPDLGLFNQLLAALGNIEYHLFMAGDIGQLAPVGFGVVWHKLHDSKVVPYIELNQIHRQANENPIKQAAQAIRKGEMPEIPLFEGGGDALGVYLSECVNSDLIEESFDCAIKLGMRESQIIAPTKQLVDKINKFVQRKMLTQEVMADDSACYLSRFYRGDRVICTENNHEMGLQNGDVGEFIGIEYEDDYEYAHFDFHHKSYKLTEQDIFASRIKLGWCITIHKTQGSEFKNTIIVMPEPYNKRKQNNFVERSMIYTALTRSSKLSVFVGNKNALANAIMAKERWKTLKTLFDLDRYHELDVLNNKAS
ncbi:MAG: exodeoxyribonuclease V alpha subunit [Flavobacteriaceae bacterium]|jgi:exodeoxyribonuclease V alpha subunit